MFTPYYFILLFLSLSCGKVTKQTTPELDLFSQQQIQSGGLLLVNTVDDSYSSGSMALVPLAQTDLFVQDLHTTTNSDFYLRCRGNIIYRIESFNQDRITLFDRLHPQNILAQILTKPIQEPVSSVPIDLAFGPADSALLLRYSRNRGYWMNSANNSLSVQSELDFGSFSDADGYSEAKSALYWDGLWYITHQRLNRLSSNGWSDSNISKLAIVRHETPNSMTSFDLKIRNPISKMIKVDGNLLVAGAGDLMRINKKFAGVEVIGREISVIDGNITHQSKRVILAGKQIIDMEKMDQNNLLAIEYVGPSKTNLH
jgi:hypothetical protein